MQCVKCFAYHPDCLPVRFDSVAGQEHAKRAAEIALVGRHSIAFIGYSDACETLAAVVAETGKLATFAVPPCPCGNAGEPLVACVCSAAMIGRYERTNKAYLAAQQAQLHVYLTRPSAEKLKQFALQHRVESDETIMERVRVASLVAPIAPDALDASAQSLLTAALRQLSFTEQEMVDCLAVAATIERMQYTPAKAIRAAALAEAIQYRRRNVSS